uniref:Serine protease 55 n=1 Tax=Ascaris suum TaxID=6253 RepID=F1LB91_ASCSU
MIWWWLMVWWWFVSVHYVQQNASPRFVISTIVLMIGKLIPLFSLIRVYLALASSYYDPEVCGKPLKLDNRFNKIVTTNEGPTFRVMGGKDVPWGIMPWAVAIYDDEDFVCGGVLISKRHIVTAAHCFTKAENLCTGNCSTEWMIEEKEIIKTFAIGYGSNCITLSNETACLNSPPMKYTTINRVEIGTFFEHGCVDSDIALLEMKDEIDDSANYACLPHRLMPETYRLLVTFGWGSNPAIGMKRMNVLQMFAFPRLMPLQRCRKLWGNIPKDAICTRERPTRNVCAGDSGGGLLVKNTEKRWILLGVVSFGTSCKSLLFRTSPPRAQIYTSLQYHNADIDRFIGDTLPHIQFDDRF